MSQLGSEITELQGKLTADWKGEKVPLSALSVFMSDKHRETRRQAFEAKNNASETICETLDEKFESLLDLREKIAKNAGFETYTKYAFKKMRRFDWDEADCFAFHAAVKKHIVPLAAKLCERKKQRLGLDTVRPYDLRTDSLGRDPLKICDPKDCRSLIDGAGKIVKAVDDELYGFFEKIKNNSLLDLECRDNKAPGGYMMKYPVYEMASVFYNGTGLSYDLMVLLHELGHCFHYFLSKDIAPQDLQTWTAEVAESGSMSMEYIGLENLTEYISEADAKRMKEDKLESVVDLFISCAMGDEFQHWIYANPKHSRQERRDKWLELSKTYHTAVDRTGYEDVFSKTAWQYFHILQAPFYLIDYSISELVALSIWDRYKNNRNEGVAYYKRGCSVGSSKTVPEIFKEFGAEFKFDESVIEPLARRLDRELGF